MDLQAKLAAGGVAVVVGGAPPALPGRQVVRVRCGGGAPLGPWFEARDRLTTLVEAGDSRLVDAMADRLRSGLRRRLLGEAPGTDPTAALLARLSSLAARLGPTVLVFEEAQAADPATVALLARAAREPGLVPFPVVVHLRDAAATEAARVLARLGGAEPPPSEPPPAPARSPAAPSPAHPPEVLVVLRAAAFGGPRFEVDAVAARLGTSPVAVLVALQRAVDAGEALVDHGDGVLSLPPDRAAELRAGILPSLARRWDATTPPAPEPLPPAPPLPAPDLASAPAPSDDAPGGVPPSSPAPPPAAPVEPFAPVADPDGASGPLDDAPMGFAEPPEPAPSLDELVPSAPPAGFGFGRDEAPEPAHPPPTLEAAVAPTAAPRAPVRADGEEQAHLALAHARAREVAGEIDEAIAEIRGALASLGGRRARSPESRRLAVALHAELGRLLWRAAGPGAEFTLDGALDALARAEEGLADDDPASLRALVWSAQAAVLQDRGDPEALEAALRKLDAAMRALQAAGEARAAARLLNDQAGVWVRLGDPVRAAHLLRESRAVFARATDPDGRMELAETDLCLARLPLHARTRPGAEPQAWARALEHARDAAATWTQLGMSWEAARARETEGRLLVAAGDLDGGVRVLAEAANTQAELGDVLGVARTSAALAEALAQAGRPRDALEMLGQSVRLNAAKGSAAGVAWNRRAFDQLWSSLDSRARRALLPTARPVAEALEAAERRTGRLRLPEDED